jgi:hypothetical protein
MKLRLVSRGNLAKGDLVIVKSMPKSDHFCIIGFKNDKDSEPVAILKALFNDTYIIEKPVSELTSLLIRGKL